MKHWTFDIHMLISIIILRRLERPIQFRYTEIEAFPATLNSSQKANWMTRIFLTEAKKNLTDEDAAGRPSKWTPKELDDLEKTLKDHESWLNEWVEKQKAVKSWENPVIETVEMKARAKVLENHLQKLYRRKVPKAKKVIKPPPASTASPQSEGEPVPPPEGGKQIPLKRDEL